jgi:hypothetical protein
MIQRFNFYDIYGYLVPGVVLLAAFWLPFGLVLGRWPSADWSSALVGLVLAYVAGHILHTFSESALPQSAPLPSHTLLNSGDKGLSAELKDRLYLLIKNQFGIDVRPLSAQKVTRQHEKELVKRRKDAFFLCREFLIRRGAASYAEQFQGMYALMRGVAAALFLGAMFHFGWISGDLWSSPWLPDVQRSMSFIGIGILVLLLLKINLLKLGKDEEAWLLAWLWLLLPIGVFVSGCYFGCRHAQGWSTAVSMFCFGTGSLCVVYVSYSRYEKFAGDFAKSVYRGFASLY